MRNKIIQYLLIFISLIALYLFVSDICLLYTSDAADE